MKKPIKREVICVCVFLFATLHLVADPPYLFTKLSEKDWVIPSANSIYKQDGKFLWLGTNHGVYRFDGYTFKHYSDHAADCATQDDRIYKVVTDDLNNLWILTNRGLGIYNSENDNFEYEKTRDSVQGPVFSSCSLKNGMLFGGQDKIFFFDYKTKRLTSLPFFQDTKGTNNLTHLCKLSEEEIIVNSKNDILKLNLNNHHVTTFKCADEISCLYVDDSKRIWAGSYNNGLTCFTADGKIIKNYNNTNSRLNCNAILCIAQQDSLLWIGTDGGGINIINTQNDTFTILKHIMGEPQSFPPNSIKCLFRDKNESIWAGSVRSGIIRIRKSHINSYIETYQDSQYGLSNKTVLALFQDSPQQYLWIGTDGEGINRMDLTTRTFKHYPHTNGKKITSIANYNTNNLLLSIYLEGLFLFNKQTGKLQPFSIKDNHINTDFLVSKISTNLYNETNDKILLLTNKIYRYHTKTQQIEELVIDSVKGNTNILPAGMYNSQLFFYDNLAIYKLKRNSSTLETVSIIPKGQHINSADMDTHGDIWIATNEGVMIYSYEKNTFRKINSSLFHNISTIKTDKQGNAWIGEKDKLYAYLHQTNSFALFGESDGVAPNEYIQKSRLVTTQGDVILGGTQGLVIIDHLFELKNIEIPKIELTEVKIDDEVSPYKEVDNEKIIHVASNNEAIEIQIATIENDILRPKVYKYEVKGANEYVLESYFPILKINSPIPGKSSVYASCRTRNGEWTKPTYILTIDVQQEWYKTPLFKLACVVILLTMIVYAVISRYRRKENLLKLELKEREKDIYEAKVRFLININHELRTPLTLISGPLKKLIQNTEVSSTQYTSLNKIYHQAERMKGLLNMVLDLRKMEVGKGSLNIESHPINDWIHNIVADFDEDDNASGIKLKTELTDQLTTINFDSKKCEIILTNLLVNAIKHSSRGDTIRITSEVTDDDQYLTVSVIDQGPGLPEADIDKLFTNFYQGENEKTGTGIGLAYSKLLIELQDGYIGAKNNETRGATFFYKLPLNLPVGDKGCESKPYLNQLLVDNKKESKIDYNLKTKAYDTSMKTILIVDDNIELTEFISESFTNLFKEVFIAHNGIEALQLLAKVQPDIIVSDIMMPDMDGYELCQNIKNNIEYCHIPFILLTARNEALSSKLGYKIGADAFISKPFDIDSLYDIIASKLKIRDDMKQKYIRLSGLPEPEADTFNQLDEKFLIKLNEIITQNIENSALDIPFICKEIGISRASLYNKMKAITGISCNEYINKIRLEKAIALVKGTNKSFVEISDETGFSNSKYFSTSFKQYTGKTPTQYRKEYQSQQKDQHNQ